MKSATVQLQITEAKLIMESLIEMEKKWAKICEESESEDEIAEIGNDLIELRLLIDSLKNQVVPVFGNGLLNFSRSII